MQVERLPRCEEQVMAVIWKPEGASDLMTTMERVNAEFCHTWKPQTVSTFLRRLVKRGYLSDYRQGRYTYYRPAVGREAYKEAVMEELERLF